MFKKRGLPSHPIIIITNEKALGSHHRHNYSLASVSYDKSLTDVRLRKTTREDFVLG